MNKYYHLSPLILQTFIWIPTRVFFKTFYSYSVNGLNNIKRVGRKRGVIFVVNHSNELDPIMIPASLPFLDSLMPMFYVSRESKFYKSSGWRQHIYGGLFFRLWGAYQAYTGLRNYDLALRHHIEILRDGKSLCIFPEGYMTRDGNIADGKPGVAFLAHKTRAVIIPVRIKGLYKPHAKRDFLGRIKLSVTFGKPIYPKALFKNPEKVTLDDFKEKRAVIMDAIRAL